MRKVGLFDLDGSLADYYNEMLRRLRTMAHPDEPPLAIDIWKEENHTPHIAARMWYIKDSIGFWRGLAPIESGLDVYRLSHHLGFENVVLSRSPDKHPIAAKEKIEWCLDHLEKPRITLSGDKDLVYGSFLFDDHPDYVDAWLVAHPTGIAIMPDTLLNREYTHERMVRYTNNLEEVGEVLRKLYVKD